MSYSAYELTAGTSCLQKVEAWERHLTNNGNFDANSKPSLSQVEGFISDSYYEIGAWLVEYGYAQSQTDTDVKGALEKYNALGACALIELTQPSVGFRGGENTRYERFFKEYMKVKDLIQSAGFQRLGATKSWELSTGLSAGGISISDKETIETDSDHEPYFFERDLHRHPGTIAEEEEED